MAETERPTTVSSSNKSLYMGGLSSLSPANSACLTTSLSRRRLRASGSLKTASSSSGVLNFPMFGANGGRKRSGSGHGNKNKNVEPSSPKVTCIGQVRVKTRKHVNRKLRSRSRREGGSLRRSSSDQNDGGGRRFDGSWVHLPVTICESLRALGSELNCLSPCRSSCTGNNGDRGAESDNGGGNSCGAVFTRWFVAVEETGGGRREIELVVGGAEEEGRDMRRSRRRHVFENLDLSIIERKTVREERDDAPPKNALLLMRCRSDPVKVAALANRVRERQMSLNDVAYGSDEEEEEDDKERIRRFELDKEDKKRIQLCENWISDKTIAVPVSEPEALEDLSVEEEEEASKIHEVDSFEEKEEEIEAMIIKTIEDNIRNAIEEEIERSDQGNQEPDPSPEVVMRGSQLEEETTETTTYKVLPDCLLLMMCEPKLSMEVSKETWVCSTDFVRCQPGRRPPAKKIPEAPGDHHHHHHHQSKKRIVSTVDSNASSRRRSVDKRPVHIQPPRSSCSYPAAPPVITAVGEQEVAGGNKANEQPPMLPRCKSEPRKSASRLAPETCLWKNRKLEQHSPATVAGVGF